MTLQLDARRVAMLREMGLLLLPPLQAPAAADAGVMVAREPATSGQAAPMPRVGSSAPSNVVAPNSAENSVDLALLDWDGLLEAMRACAGQGDAGRRMIPGVGPQRADWMVVGDVPGEAEEQQGEPFAGPAGKLLDNMLRAIGLDRGKQVYVTNLLKCRPPGDRNPEPDELARWEPFLRREVALVQPRLILVMGRFAVATLLRTQDPVGRLRGRLHQYEGVQVVATYHPNYLLRTMPDKARAWADLCLAQDAMAGAQVAASGL